MSSAAATRSPAAPQSAVRSPTRSRSRACTRKRRLARLAGALSALALCGLPSGSAAASAGRVSLPVIERQVMCVTCKIPLNVAQSPQADRERAFIQSLIDRGLSEGQIKRALVAEYGSTVLALPSAHGFDLAAYLVPLAVLAALVALATMLLVRWRHRASEPAPAPIPEELSKADAARLQADLARFD
jgi:cytochrome c-type biogenesis protein CcmH